MVERVARRGPAPAYLIVTIFIILHLTPLFTAEVYGYYHNDVKIIGYDVPSTAVAGQTVLVQLTVWYRLDATKLGVVISRELPDGSWERVWYNPDYELMRSGQGSVSYVANFPAPDRPNNYRYAIHGMYWYGNEWVTTDVKYFYIQVQQPQEVLVSLTVTDRRGRPLEGARLTIVPDSGVRTLAEPGGSFKLWLPANRVYNLSFEWYSMYGVPARFSISGRPYELQALGRVLMPVDDVVLRVVDLEGRPVDAAVVFGGVPVPFSVEMIVGGDVIFQQVPLYYTYKISVLWPDLSGVEVGGTTLYLDAGTSVTLSAALRSLGLSVVDRQGRPLTGARVSIAPNLVRPDDIQLRPDAIFTLLRIPDGITYDFTVEWTSPYGTTARALVRDTPAGLQARRSITVPVDDITLNVVDFDGRPVAGAAITFAGQDIGSTDNQGILIVGQVPLDNDYGITVNKEGVEVGSDRVRFTAAKTSATIKADIYDITVLVKGATGQPLTGAIVELRKAGAVIKTGATDERGQVRFEKVIGDDYTVEARFDPFIASRNLPKGTRNTVVMLDIQPPTRTATPTTAATQGTEAAPSTLLIIGVIIGAVLGLAIALIAVRAGRR